MVMNDIQKKLEKELDAALASAGKDRLNAFPKKADDIVQEKIAKDAAAEKVVPDAPDKKITRAEFEKLKASFKEIHDKIDSMTNKLDSILFTLKRGMIE